MDYRENMKSNDSLLRAIKIIGSRQKLAQLLGISPQRLNAWLNGSVDMGYEYAVALEHLTANQVTAADLTPNKAKIITKISYKPHKNKDCSKKHVQQNVIKVVTDCLMQVLCEPNAEYVIKRINSQM
jgi:DNA-binding transcriptional regulator YdaS (Cro superfamily)